MAATKKTRRKLKERFYLTFPQSLIKKPVICWLAKRFDVIFNIRSATVTARLGVLALEIEGPEGELQRALEWLKNQGILVEPIEKNIIE